MDVIATVKNSLKIWWDNKYLTVFVFLATILAALGSEIYSSYDSTGNASMPMMMLVSILFAIIGFFINIYFTIVASNSIIALNSDLLAGKRPI